MISRVVLAGILFTISIFPVVASAREVFNVDVIPCGPTVPLTAPGADGCGSNPAGIDPLTAGSVRVEHTGKVRVMLKGAPRRKTYLVTVANWIPGSFPLQQFNGIGTTCPSPFKEIGSVTTDSMGNYNGPIRLPSPASGVFAFPARTRLGQPNFAFSNLGCITSQFTSGFRIP